MRKIIINRKKTMAGCLGKVLIYTIDKLEEDMIVTKDKCMYLGQIKNGKSLEVEIPNEEVTILAAYDSLGVFMITDYMTIHEGKNDITINGKVHLNPLNGNPFLFENNS